MKPFPDFSTPKGIRAVADHLDSLALYPTTHDDSWHARHVIGCMRIRPTFDAFTRAAALLRENVGRRAREHACGAMETNVPKMDAVRHCGSPEAALATIRRQLTEQGESMEPADVRRCERAAGLIEAHVAKVAADAAQAAADKAEAERIAKGKVPDSLTITPAGIEVHVNKDHRSYLATVEACKVGAHPILGAKYRTALYTVRATHIRETRNKRYAFHPIKPRLLKRIIALDVSILPAA